MRTTKIIVCAAVIHGLLTLFVSPIGWEYLYSWDSPHWLRAVWACLFSLPLLIVFAHGWFPAWGVFVVMPLNSLLLSWMVIKPIQNFLEFRQTGQKCVLTRAAVGLCVWLILLGTIAAIWVPPNIVSAKEALLHNLREIDRWTHTNNTQRP
jgi:hypothetical protein